MIYNGPDAEHDGKEICFNSNEDTLTIVDVTNKASPVMLSRTGYTGVAYTHQGWLTEDQAYFLLDDELDEQDFGHGTTTRVWDVSDLDLPAIVDVFENSTPAIDHNQYIRGNCTFQANYRAGLRILDFDPAGVGGTLTELAYFDIYPADNAALFNAAWSNYPYFPSGNVVVSGIEQGLFILKPSDTVLEACGITVTPPPPPPPIKDVHLESLSGMGNTTGAKGGKWNAVIMVEVHDAGEVDVENATVSGTWSDGASGSGSCTTDSNGACMFEELNINRRSASATFTVDSISGTNLNYVPGSNHANDSVTVINPN